MKFTIALLMMITTNVLAQQKAGDFTTTTIEGKEFRLSDLKGKKIFLSFFRNGACALCNLRVHEISNRQHSFDSAGIVVLAVFESSIDDMRPFVGKQRLEFTLLSDPKGKIYDQYGITNSQEIVNKVMTSGSANARVQQAAEAGFMLAPQEGANFFRIPAEVMIDEEFNVIKIHHCGELIDHLPIDEVITAFK
jgi:peroxiredoxin Q/BCP